MPGRPDYDEQRFELIRSYVRKQKWRLFSYPAKLKGHPWWYEKGFFFLVTTLYYSDWDFKLTKKKVAELMKKTKEDTWVLPGKAKDVEESDDKI